MKLSNNNIAKVVEDTQDFFEQAGVSKRDVTKINLVFEESLLRWQEYFGAEQEFQVQTRKWFGTPKVLIRLKGAPFNPFKTPDDDFAILSAEIMQNLLIHEGTRTTYSYTNGYNELSTVSTKERKPIKLPGGSITVAILIAIAASFVIEKFPQPVQTFLVDDLAVPLLNTLMGLIIAVTIPTVFISVVASICVMENVTTLSNIGFKVIRRFVFIMALIISVATCASAVLFPVVSFAGGSKALIGEIISLLLSTFPNSIFQPFIDGNILQIVMIALFTGVCIVILGQRAADLKPLINATKELFFKMTELILKLIPLTIFLSIFKTVMKTSIGELFVVWKIVAVSYITYIGVGVLMLAYLKIKYRISIADFFRKNAPVFIISMTMLSGTASMMVNFDVCKKNMNIDPNLCDFWIPLSHTLFSPSTVTNFVNCAFMGAVVSGETLSVSELLLVAFLAIQLSTVSPKVYGGSLAGYTILLTQLGFSQDVIGQMMVANVFTITMASLFGMLARNCDLYDLSHQVKFSAAHA